MAKVKVQNTGATELKGAIVRGTLPLPAKYDKPIAGLALRDGKTILPTQVAVVSTYPGSEKGYPVGRPEVVQLAARVPSLPAKALKHLEVVQLGAAPTPGEPTKPGGALAAWLAGKAPVLVEGTDCFGNRYRAEPLQAEHLIETRQAGPVLVERVYQAILRPVGEAAPDRPALKRFLRVRAYLTTYAGEDFASLALMIHNGSIDHPNGPVYYRDIRVGLAAPMAVHIWHKRFSPAADAKQQTTDGYIWQPCPAADPNGKVHVMPARGAAVLRTFLHAPAARDRALACAAARPIFVPVPSEELFSWSNFATARYGAAKYPLPLRIDRQVADKHAAVASRRLSGPGLGWSLTYLRRIKPGSSRVLGHALPAGVPYGGMTGGGGIHYVWGVVPAVTGHNAGLWLHVIMADRHWDRHWAHRFYDDGRPYLHSRHVVPDGGRKLLDVPLDRRGWPTEVAQDPACGVQAKYVADRKLLSAGARELLRYMSHDDQHLARTFDAEVGAFLACDPISRDRLVTLGTQACATLNIYPFKARPRTGGWGSLVRARQHVQARPHKGIHMGRANGWLNQAIAYAFYLSQDKQIRQDCIDVAKADTEVREQAQMPAGNVTVHRPYSKVWNGQYEYVNAWQTVGIMGNGARCLVGILSSPENQPYADRLKAVYARVGMWSATVGWDEKLHAPAGNVGLRKKGQKEYLEKPYISAKRAGTNYYFGSPYVWYYELTGKRLFVDRLREMTGGNVAPSAYRHLPNWSYVLWLAQGGRIPGREGF